MSLRTADYGFRFLAGTAATSFAIALLAGAAPAAAQASDAGASAQPADPAT